MTRAAIRFNRLHSVKFAHQNGKSRITIYLKCVKMVHPFSHFIVVIIEKYV